MEEHAEKQSPSAGGSVSAAPGELPQRLSFSGDAADEASVASARAAAATGEPVPWMDGDRPLRTVAVGPGVKAVRSRRSPEETALVREVARRITAYRETHGLTQRALAERLDMPQPSLARLELGLHTPTLETLARLASVLDMTFIIEVSPQGVRLQPAA